MYTNTTYVSQLLISACKRSGVYQKEIALKLNVTNQFVCNWINSRSYPPPKYYKEISKLLRIDKDALVQARLKDFEMSLKAESR